MCAIWAHARITYVSSTYPFGRRFVRTMFSGNKPAFDDQVDIEYWPSFQSLLCAWRGIIDQFEHKAQAAVVIAQL